MATVNLASRYAKEVDERFVVGAKSNLFFNNDFKFNGVESISVYSVPTVPMSNYNRGAAAGIDRYGKAEEMGNKVQILTMKQDRSWTSIIDKANRMQTQMVMDAGKAASRQINEVIIPEFDLYVFNKLGEVACDNAGHFDVTGAATAKTAYQRFLKAQEVLGDSQVPDSGRVCACSYAFANFLMQDPSFVRYGDLSQKMIVQGLLGEVDGVKITRVPKSRLPEGCNFIMTHKMACCAPKILSEFKIHTDPPGISGWKIEGRVMFDAFVLDNKKDAIYYDGSADVAPLVLPDAAASEGP